jgi:hypothetical protein
MTALEIYALAAPAIAFFFMAAFGLCLLRRDIAHFKLLAASNAAASATTVGGRSVTEPAPSQPEKVVAAADAIVHAEDAVGSDS